MTYEELAVAISKLTPAQKQDQVTIYTEHDDEYYELGYDGIKIADNTCDVLDPGHPYLKIV